MRRRFLLLLMLVIGKILPAQIIEKPDSNYLSKEEMKKIFIVRKNPEEQHLNSSPLILREISEKDLEEKDPKKSYKSIPSLVSDKEGLMNMLKLEPYGDRTKAPQNQTYVVFAFSINEQGFVSDIVIYDTNERSLVDILVRKLDQTRWKAAFDSQNKRSAYNFGKWIAVLPTKVKKERYEDFRF
jgi:hypothetical protein